MNYVDSLWNLFRQTGQIEFYLLLKEVEKDGTPDQETMAEQGSPDCRLGDAGPGTVLS